MELFKYKGDSKFKISKELINYYDIDVGDRITIIIQEDPLRFRLRKNIEGFKTFPYSNKKSSFFRLTSVKLAEFYKTHDVRTIKFHENANPDYKFLSQIATRDTAPFIKIYRKSNKIRLSTKLTDILGLNHRDSIRIFIKNGNLNIERAETGIPVSCNVNRGEFKSTRLIEEISDYLTLDRNKNQKFLFDQNLKFIKVVDMEIVNLHSGKDEKFITINKQTQLRLSAGFVRALGIEEDDQEYYLLFLKDGDAIYAFATPDEQYREKGAKINSNSTYGTYYSVRSSAKNFLFDHFGTLEKGTSYRIYFSNSNEEYNGMTLFEFLNIEEIKN